MNENIFSDHTSQTTRKNTTILMRMKQNLAQTFSRLDWKIISLTGILIIIGLVSVFSATMPNDPVGTLRTQIFAITLGVIAGLVVLSVPAKWLTDYRLVFLSNFVILALMFVTLLIGKIGGGARSWLMIVNRSFQPSEFFKLTSVWLIAWSINHTDREEILSQKKIHMSVNQLAALTILGGCLLIILQPDMGMLMIIAISLFLVKLYIDGSSKWVSRFYGAMIVVYIGLHLVSNFFDEALVSYQGMMEHFFERIAVFTNPFKYPLAGGYQLIEGYKALADGGLLGVGLFNGQAKQGRLPEIHTDFIFANIGEELGLVGCSVIIILYTLLFLILYQRAARSRDVFRRSMIVGFANMLAVQTFTNIAGLASLIPLTGVTLPFISVGGTSLLVSIIMIAMVLRMIVEEENSKDLRLISNKKG